MKHQKYWGKRLRLFGDIVAGTIAALSITHSGLAAGSVIVANLPLVAVGLLVALVVWLSFSFVSAEMDDDDES